MLLRLFLSAAAAYMFWITYRFWRVSLPGRTSPSYAAEQFSRAERGGSSARKPVFPWPNFPGARIRSEGASAWNGIPVLKQEVEIAASAERILAFYGRRLAGRGWRDTTEDHFMISPDSLERTGRVINLQNEQFLRRYDAVKRSQLHMVKGDAVIMVQVHQGSRPWKHLVALRHLASKEVIDVVTQVPDYRPGTSRAPKQLMTTDEVIGGTLHSTSFHAGRIPPGRMLSHLVRTLKRDGWGMAEELPMLSWPTGARGEQMAYLAKGSDFAIVYVKPGRRRGTSEGMITRMLEPKGTVGDARPIPRDASIVPRSGRSSYRL